MIISPEIIDDIKFKNPIEDVISSYVNLKRAGSNYNGLCPFHSEKTPSFTVFPSTQSFYCFGCGAGGDAITFVMRTENLDYLSALRVLASRCGVTIPENDVLTTGKKEVGRQRILEMNKEAAKFFHNCLLDEKLGAPGRKYLMNERKLSMAVINHFGLGYAPNNFFMLHDHLKKLGYTDDEMVVGFLCGKNDRGIYDYYRNRVIFPIIDIVGNVIAFGGRVLDDSKPKYLNTSDTPAFKKSKNLFALNFAKNHCEKQLVLCEGYMDVIALHAAGIENAVATLGTAITPEQARIFSRYTKKVIISYDSDEAGQRAADKAFKLLQEVGVDVKILKMKDAKDPDEYIKKFGASSFRSVIDDSKSKFEFECEKILTKYNILNTDEKVKAGHEICIAIASYPSEIEREIYCQKMSKVLDIPKESIKRDVLSIIKRRSREAKRNEETELYRKSSGIGDRVNPSSAEFLKANKIEEAILGLMQLYPSHLKLAIEKMKTEDFVTPLCKKIFKKIKECYEKTGKFDIAFIEENFNVDEISRITKMMAERQRLATNGEDVLLELISSLSKEKEISKDEDTVDSILDAIKKKKK
ncbi:MAG: DNA primase [Clostridia bacterium]|nr:DNA primase [Clostridia bacterium]